MPPKLTPDEWVAVLEAVRHAEQHARANAQHASKLVGDEHRSTNTWRAKTSTLESAADKLDAVKGEDEN